MPDMMADAQELLTKVGHALARSTPEWWSEMELRISGAGGMTGTVVVATRGDGSVDRGCELDDDGDGAAAELREAMYQEGQGTWYNARLTLDGGGQLDVEFDYDNPPFDGEADPGLLIEDQRLFPREAEALSAWHPCRDH
jgi:hypothetical protein